MCVCCCFLGWWFGQCEAQRGWVPGSYLEPLDGPDESEEQEPNYAGHCAVEIVICNYLASFNKPKMNK